VRPTVRPTGRRAGRREDAVPSCAQGGKLSSPAAHVCMMWHGRTEQQRAQITIEQVSCCMRLCRSVDVTVSCMTCNIGC
jgi:hypothetical protein